MLLGIVAVYGMYLGRKLNMIVNVIQLGGARKRWKRELEN